MSREKGTKTKGEFQIMPIGVRVCLYACVCLCVFVCMFYKSCWSLCKTQRKRGQESEREKKEKKRKRGRERERERERERKIEGEKDRAVLSSRPRAMSVTQHSSVRTNGRERGSPLLPGVEREKRKPTLLPL